MDTDKKKKKFGAEGLNALNTALNTVNEAVEKHHASQKKSDSLPLQPFDISNEKTDRKNTVGVNILLPKDIYTRLQSLRMDMDNIPLRTLCLNLVIEGLERNENKN